MTKDLEIWARPLTAPNRSIAPDPVTITGGTLKTATWSTGCGSPAELGATDGGSGRLVKAFRDSDQRDRPNDSALLDRANPISQSPPRTPTLAGHALVRPPSRRT